MQLITTVTHDFKEIIQSGYHYVDKTDILYRLVQNKGCFLSRPRRFGKSLNLSTLKYLFKGEKELFKGLKIESLGYNFEETYPVLLFSMDMSSSTPNELKNELLNKLKRLAEMYEISIVDGLSAAGTFGNLIQDISKKYKKQIVILVDEYDLPLSMHPDKPDLQKENSQLMKVFFSQIKSNIEYIRFVLVTGVSRVALSSGSFGLNNLDEITYNKNYSTICGFTKKELVDNFSNLYDLVLEELQSFQEYKHLTKDTLTEEILNWYDGYSFDGNTRVLNPISILSFFKNISFDNYWVNTGPSETLLNNIIKKNIFFFNDKRFTKCSTKITDNSSSSGGWDFPASILLQTGYLTIDSKIKRNIYTLRIPNFEIQTDLFERIDVILKTRYPKKFCDEELRKQQKNMKNFLVNHDTVILTEYFESAFTIIPSMHTDFDELDEFHFHDFLHLYLYGQLGVINVYSEISSSQGRSDLIVELEKDVYLVIEIKYLKTTETNKEKIIIKMNDLADEALKQITEKNYSAPYLSRASDLIEIGLAVAAKGLSLANIRIRKINNISQNTIYSFLKQRSIVKP